MTIATEIATRGSWNSTDIDNMVTESFDDLSLYAGKTISEGSSSEWDRIAKIYAIWLLDMLVLRIKALSDHSIQVPQGIPQDIRDMIDDLKNKDVEATPSDHSVYVYSSPASRNLDAYET